jgi:tetrahydromethanopterin S-methyltransferase subunit C
MYWPFTKKAHHLPIETAIAGTGAVIGVAWGWIAGIAALSIPGVGPFLACGPIIGAMSGVSIGAALGGVGGGLIGMGIPETAARSYEERILKGEILLSVHTESRGEMDLAKGIFDDSRADDIWASDPPKPSPV